KGYKEAGAISGGELVQQVGGGVCQVSTTLFNAVARSDLGIVDRSPHAWPSTYVDIGEDATVDWPNLDFKFKNTKTTPIFIIMYYKNKKCSAEIWGMTLGDGISIDLDSKITKTINPPSEVLYVQNSSLPVGTSEQTVKARTGYVVDTYAVWYQNGKETKRDKLYTSTYKAYQRTVEYN
ncbi:MAG: VanW family protein, partial [Eubacteriales bacterium]|nr:VanW family protein [Eubacteriales bacterium]